MKVTFTIKDVTEAFFNGFGESIKGLNNMTDAEKFSYLTQKVQERALKISMKIATGQFRDRVELNQILRKPDVSFAFKLEPRKGYKLASFEIN